MRSLPWVVVLLGAALGPGCDVLPPGVPVRTAQVPLVPADPGEDSDVAEDPCEGFRQPGCVQAGCPEGQVCQRGPECVPSLCSCDPATGQSVCSLDCGGGTCVEGTGECPPSTCRLLCAFGHERDEDGCELCRCREPPSCPCTRDEDCVKVTTGCCPCELGGTELALGRACVQELAQCPVQPAAVPCLAFNRCTKKQAACVAGECVLQNRL